MSERLTPEEEDKSPDYPRHKQPSIRIVMMPRDTNAVGTIFGGVILDYIDLAAAVEAHLYQPGKVVTVAMDKIEFRQPVHVGDVVSFFTEASRIGRTSITIKVDVWAQRAADRREFAHVTNACVTMVAVDDDMRPVPISGKYE